MAILVITKYSPLVRRELVSYIMTMCAVPLLELACVVRLFIMWVRVGGVMLLIRFLLFLFHPVAAMPAALMPFVMTLGMDNVVLMVLLLV